MTTYVGVIGGGNISDTHARAARAIPDVSVAAVYGTNAEKAARLARDHHAQRYRDFEAFLAHRPMDLVLIGSPSGCHAAEGIAAAQHGLHVLTEKPLDITTTRADALIDAAARAKVKLGVFFQDRTKPDIRKLKQWVDHGVVGKPLLIDARVKWYRPPEYYSGSKWRGLLALDGGGALMNQGVHTVDVLLWLFGDPVRVQARTGTLLHSIEAEDTAVAILEFSSGALCTLQATTAAYPGYPRRIEISGSNGTVVLEHDRLIAADLRDAPADLLSDSSGDTNQSGSSAVVSDVSGHKAVLEDFLRAIQQDTKPLCDGHEGRRSVALIEEIYRAAKVSTTRAGSA
jgi:UDP-N-acetyl-2-amino-2-deoxyglucuronate dehydrogenase